MWILLDARSGRRMKLDEAVFSRAWLVLVVGILVLFPVTASVTFFVGRVRGTFHKKGFYYKLLEFYAEIKVLFLVQKTKRQTI